MTADQDLKGAEQEARARVEAGERDLGVRADAFLQEHGARLTQINGLYQQMAFTGADNSWAINAAEEQALGALRGFCDHLGEWQTWFLGFEPLARQLAEAGSPQLAVRLGEILADLSNASGIYRTMAEDMVRHRQGVLRIQSDAINYATQAIRGAADNQRRVFDACLQRWSNETFNKCPLCGALLHSRSLPYCGSCRALVVRF